MENGYQRSLHFGSEPRQSSMDFNDPFYLALSYTRAMLGVLLFAPAPRRVLLVGLGGGSLAKFLWRHYPQCQIDAVEYRPLIHDLAQRYFQLPQDERLRIHIADAADFMRQADSRYSDYDFIFLDAFTAEGVAEDTVRPSFFADCRARLSAQGALAANLWAEDRFRLESVIGDLADTFEGRLLRLPIDGKANLIALAMQQGQPRKALRELDAQAKNLQRQLDVEFIVFLKLLRKHNRYWGFI